MNAALANTLAQIRQRLYRRRSYRAVFLDDAGALTEAGAAVLADLARFACVQSTTARRSSVTGAVDAHATMLAEGRRQLFTRITRYLNVTESQIYSLMEREHGYGSTQQF